jgi:hypothetical protein
MVSTPGKFLPGPAVQHHIAPWLAGSTAFDGQTGRREEAREAGDLEVAVEMDAVSAEAYERAVTEEAFKDEPYDRVWASDAKRQLEEGLLSSCSKFASARVVGVECRKTMCRAEMRVSPPPVYDELLADFRYHGDWRGPGRAYRTLPEVSGDETAVLVFLGRPGSELPEVEH